MFKKKKEGLRVNSIVVPLTHHENSALPTAIQATSTVIALLFQPIISIANEATTKKH